MIAKEDKPYPQSDLPSVLINEKENRKRWFRQSRRFGKECLMAGYFSFQRMILNEIIKVVYFAGFLFSQPLE